MAAIWPSFISGFVSYVSANNAKSENDTAKKIAQLYHASVQTAMPLLVPGATPVGLTPSPIESGFSAAFKAAKAMGEAKPSPATYMPAAAGIVAYWTGKTFTPIPPPTWISGTNNILFPDLNNVDYTSGGHELDIVSNGFKIKNNNNRWNTSGGRYIYMVFAEQINSSPFDTETNGR